MAEQSKNPELRKRVMVLLDGDKEINIPASEMDRDGDHLVFMNGADLVAVIRMNEVRSAYIATVNAAKT